MSGLSRLFFALLASFLRLVAWVPFVAADRLNKVALACDERAGR